MNTQNSSKNQPNRSSNSDSDPAPATRGLIRPVVAAMPLSMGPAAETPATAAAKGARHRMNLNECAYPPSPKVVAAVTAAMASINRYPDNRYTALREVMSADLGVPGERIFYASGSDTILQAISDMVVDEDTSVVIPDPSFRRYNLSVQLRGGTQIPVPVAQDGRNDVDAMLAAVRPDTRIMFVASPNNPTGQMLDEAEVIRLAKETPDHVLLAMDEAYFEFARREGGVNCLEVIRDHRQGPWCVLRTFSKAYGLAGMRIGYVVCGSDEVVGGFNRVRTAFNLSAAAQAAALAAYQDQDHCRWLIEQVARERGRVVAGLAELGLTPLPSVGNFLAVEMPGPGTLMITALAGRGVLISGINTPTPGFKNYIRITMGTAEDTDAFLTALGEELTSGRVYG